MMNEMDIYYDNTDEYKISYFGRYKINLTKLGQRMTELVEVFDQYFI